MAPAASAMPAYFPRVRCGDRKSTRLNSSHSSISYAVFCLKKSAVDVERRTVLSRVGPSVHHPGHFDHVLSHGGQLPADHGAQTARFFFKEQGDPELLLSSPKGRLPV